MGPLDRDHLMRLKMLCERYAPESFSEHLAWSSHKDVYLNDLLPLPYTQQTLARVAEHIDEVQTALGRQMLLENPSTYIRFFRKHDPGGRLPHRSYRSEPDADCCSTSTTSSFGEEPRHAASNISDSFPCDQVKEIHLGGHAEEVDDVDARC